MNKDPMTVEKDTQAPEAGYRVPDIQGDMNPQPEVVKPNYKASGKLHGKVALITGGDSGIGQAIAVLYAKEGARVAIVYLEADQDAEGTKQMVEKEGSDCLLIKGDVGDPTFATQAVEQTIKKYGQLDILINNAAEQHYCEKLEDITNEQFERTFQTNIFGTFYFSREAIKHLKKGSTIINTTSITAYKGNPELMDYSATKGAILAFTRALSQNKDVLSKQIRINAVAPGPIWTPLIPSSFPKSEVKKFGLNTPMKRPGQPSEVAPAYVYLASDDASYMSGQTIHINGATTVNG
ncbi:SDR family oxidoreductase [Terrilactibacillus sp. BCM23-1]|uniref:SDR family oxidoreductase n=1 Tax=Terrilactibacillus tamarindi TaxID=2599694 RepID=A0A6N8CN39_9BACI|nr:SDR family oxidoreductase [Terrilactibacillus tamarindi]